MKTNCPPSRLLRSAGHDCSSEPRRCFTQGQGDLTEAQLDAVPRRFTRPMRPGGVNHSARRRCGHKAVDRFIQANAIPRLACVRHHPPRTGGLSIRVEVRSLVPVHTRSNYPATQSCRAIRESQKPSCHTRVEPAKHRNAVPEWKQSTERKQYSECKTISGTETISEMEIIICGVTGKNTFSLTAQGIGIAIGTAIATTGRMVTIALH